jgi:hypothetical protein
MKEKVMTFKRKDLVNIEAAIRSLIETKEGKKKLIFSLVRNKKALEPEVTAIKEAFNTENDGYKKYLEELREVYNQYGAKDEEGNVKLTQTGFVMEEGVDREEVTEKISILEETHKEALESRSKEMEDYQKLLEEEVELELFPIDYESLPDEINPEVVYILDELITEPK